MRTDFFIFKDENDNEEAEEDIAVAMETESLDDQDVSNLANNISNSLNTSLQGNTGKGRKHSFFQVGKRKLAEHFYLKSY